MIFPFKIININPNINTITEIINTNTKSHDWDELNPKKKKKMEKKVERGRERKTKQGCERGGWVRPWEGADWQGISVRWVMGMKGLKVVRDRQGQNREWWESQRAGLDCLWPCEWESWEMKSSVWVRELSWKMKRERQHVRLGCYKV